MFAPQEGGMLQKLRSIVFKASARLTYSNSQVARVSALQAAYRKAEAVGVRDSAPNASQIRSLGLIDREEDTKKLTQR